MASSPAASGSAVSERLAAESSPRWTSASARAALRSINVGVGRRPRTPGGCLKRLGGVAEEREPLASTKRVSAALELAGFDAGLSRLTVEEHAGCEEKEFPPSHDSFRASFLNGLLEARAERKTEDSR